MRFSVPALVLAWAAGAWTDTIAVKGAATDLRSIAQSAQSRMYRWRDAVALAERDHHEGPEWQCDVDAVRPDRQFVYGELHHLIAVVNLLCRRGEAPPRR
jgi:hypothetical protein